MKICADCIHEYACAMWNNGNIHNMDATCCPTYEVLRESPVYLMGLLGRPHPGHERRGTKQVFVLHWLANERDFVSG